MFVPSQLNAKRYLRRVPIYYTVALAAALMFFLALAGIYLTREAGRIAPIWIANAAILSMLLVSDRRRWIYILFAAYLANILANLVAGDSIMIATMLASCNLVEIALAGLTIHRVCPDINFAKLSDLTVFAIVAGILAPLVASMLAASMLNFSLSAPYWTVLTTWFAADALGLLVFVPLFLTSVSPRFEPRQLRPIQNQWSIMLLGVNFLFTAVVFSQSTFPLLFILIPPLILIAFQTGTSGAVLANFMTTLMAIAFTIEGFGPLMLVDTTLAIRMALLQMFLATCVFVTLIVAAYLAEQARLEDKLRLMMIKSEEANAAKSNFLSTVSHELRTPLTSIRGSLGLLSAGVAGPLEPKVQNLVRIANSSSERLVRLINDMLDMEKIESGKLAFDIENIELHDIIRQAISSASNFMPEKLVRILLDDQAPGARAAIDVGRMHQILLNLLSNAIKFSPHSSVVQVELSNDERQLKISVSDQGPGIPSSFHDRIFGKFEQADSSDVRESGGTGLGLSITKALVEHMNGHITFVSREGQGSTFSVSLPLVGVK